MPTLRCVFGLEALRWLVDIYAPRGSVGREIVRVNREAEEVLKGEIFAAEWLGYRS